MLLFRSQTDGTGSDVDVEEETMDRVRDLSEDLLYTLCTDFQLGICYKPKDFPVGSEK